LKVHCPKCFGPELEQVFIKETELLTCYDCGGLWLPAKAAISLCARHGLETAQLIKPSVSSIRCPVCGQKMQRGAFIKDNIFADRCTACRGVWFDPEEVADVTALFLA